MSTHANEEKMTLELNSLIYHEMMSHPALFTHSHPHKILIIGDGECGILNEVLKHEQVISAWQIEDNKKILKHSQEHFPTICGPNPDPRVKFYFQDYAKWIASATPDFFDIIIISKELNEIAPQFLEHCFAALSSEGLLIQQSISPFQLSELKAIHAILQQAGFRDTQTLHFPQPKFPSGWRMAWMATKRGVFRRISEKEIFNKPFKTRYYNFDIHKAALALPEFIREELSAATAGETS